jgi:hypothetical protein
MPVLVLMGGRLVAALAERLGGGRQAMIAAAVTIALGVLPVRVIWAANYLMTQPDTRVIAKEWMHANVPAGSAVFIEGPNTRETPATVPLENSARKIQESIDDFLPDEPGKARYFQMKLKVLSGITYDLELVQSCELKDLDYYKSIGVEYFVVRPESYGESRLRSGWAAFVDDLREDPDVTMLRRFEPDEKKVPGPVIEIYQAR